MCDCLWQPEKPGRGRKSLHKPPSPNKKKKLKKEKSHKQTAKTPVLQAAEKWGKMKENLTSAEHVPHLPVKPSWKKTLEKETKSPKPSSRLTA